VVFQNYDIILCAVCLFICGLRKEARFRSDDECLKDVDNKWVSEVSITQEILWKKVVLAKLEVAAKPSLEDTEAIHKSPHSGHGALKNRPLLKSKSNTSQLEPTC
jgi:hypothetical protein